MCKKMIYKLHNVIDRLFSNFAIAFFNHPCFDLSFNPSVIDRLFSNFAIAFFNHPCFDLSFNPRDIHLYV